MTLRSVTKTPLASPLLYLSVPARGGRVRLPYLEPVKKWYIQAVAIHPSMDGCFQVTADKVQGY